jgi:hypothetical protein
MHSDARGEQLGAIVAQLTLVERELPQAAVVLQHVAEQARVDAVAVIVQLDGGDVRVSVQRRPQALQIGGAQSLHLDELRHGGVIRLDARQLTRQRAAHGGAGRGARSGGREGGRERPGKHTRMRLGQNRERSRATRQQLRLLHELGSR